MVNNFVFSSLQKLAVKASLLFSVVVKSDPTQFLIALQECGEKKGTFRKLSKDGQLSLSVLFCSFKIVLYLSVSKAICYYRRDGSTHCLVRNQLHCIVTCAYLDSVKYQHDKIVLNHRQLPRWMTFRRRETFLSTRIIRSQ